MLPPTAFFSPSLPSFLFPHNPPTLIPATPNDSHSLTATSTHSQSQPPTPPWIKAPPLYPQSHEAAIGPDGNVGEQPYNKGLANRRIDQTGKYAMRRIARSIGNLQKKNGDSEETQMKFQEVGFGDFYLEGVDESGFGRRMPWEKDDGIVLLQRTKNKTVSAAELNLHKVLLLRLRAEAAKMGKWVKVNKLGVTPDVVSEIHFLWNKNELAMLKFHLPLSRNMDRARQIVEMKTGGMVVWSKKNALVVYRGCDYPLGLNLSTKQSHCESGLNLIRINDNDDECEEASTSSLIHHSNFQPMSGSLYERETDRLLDELGPRFIDWWMHKPLPVDADLLPEVVPGYMPPFRRCPPFSKPQLTDAELLHLRKLAHPLPTHFVLGRNRKLQGLAAAILKLWEKSLIAKIALKWGVPNTNNEQMASELKSLTGGTLLLRNKFFIILYRGKDFVPVETAKSIIQREMELQRWQLHEENSRLKASEIFCFDNGNMEEKAKAGTLSDFKDITMEYENLTSGSTESKLQADAEKEKLIRELRMQERRLSILNFKVEKSTKELTKLNASWRNVEPDEDQELITNEERECLRKMGLKMNSCLKLGRRGVFDGVVEGLHQHWKHREVVKVITMQGALKQVIYTAKSLEAESGGILISVDKLKEGYSIIIYRGKNYKRPLHSVSKNLLSKGKALTRSLEIQRIGSLKFFANQRRQKISELQVELENVHDSRD